MKIIKPSSLTHYTTKDIISIGHLSKAQMLYYISNRHLYGLDKLFKKVGWSLYVLKTDWNVWIKEYWERKEARNKKSS